MFKIRKILDKIQILKDKIKSNEVNQSLLLKIKTLKKKEINTFQKKQ